MRNRKLVGGLGVNFKEGRFVCFKANDSEAHLAKTQKLFESEQYAHLDALYDENPEEIDLDYAEKELGLIKAETREKIKILSPLFKDILAEEKKNILAMREDKTDRASLGDSEKRMAFRSAFAILTGKASLEAETGLDKPDAKEPDPINAPLMSKLGEVLKFDLDENGLMGRSELQSAARRLRLLLADKNFKAKSSDADVELKKLQDNKRTLELEVKSLEFARLPELKKAFSVGNTAVILDGVKVARDLLTSLGFLGSNLTYSACLKMLDEIEKPTNAYWNLARHKLDALISQLETLQNEIKPIRDAREQKLAELKAPLTESNAKEAELPKLMGNKNQLEKEIKALEFDNLPYLKTQVADLIARGLASGVAISDVFTGLKGIVASLSFLSANPAYANCGRSIQLIEGNRLSSSGVLSSNRLNDLISDLELLQKDVAGLKSSKEGELSDTNLKIAHVNYPKWILDKAFPSVDAKKMEELRLAHEDALAKQGELGETYKYFTSKEPKDLHGKFAKLSTSKETPVTAKGVRDLEAKVKKAEKDHSELERLKTVFSDKETFNLNAAFQELKSLKDDYGAAKGNKNLNTEITKQSISVEFLRKEIEGMINPRNKGKRASASDISTSRNELEMKEGILGELKKQKEQHDKFREQAKKFRLDLFNYCRDYLALLDIDESQPISSIGRAKLFAAKSQPISPMDRAKLESVKSSLEIMNIDGPESVFSDLEKFYDQLKNNFAVTFKNTEKRLKESEDVLKQKQTLENEKKELEKAKAFHGDLKVVVEKMKAASDLGVILKTDKDGNSVTKELVKYMLAEFEKIDVEDINFKVSTLTAFYTTHLMHFFGSDKDIASLVTNFQNGIVLAGKRVDETSKELKDAEAIKSKNKKLTDSAAALRIIETIIAEQMPKMSLIEQKDLAKMILAEDVAVVQSAYDYETLAKRGSAELLDTVQDTVLKEKLFRIRLKGADGKPVLPFKGIKPEDLKDLTKIEQLFATGKLRCNMEKARDGNLDEINAFLALAAFQILDEKAKQPSTQAIFLEKKIKDILAKSLGAETRRNEAGVSRIIDRMYAEQLALVKPRVQAFFDLYDSNGREWNSYEEQAYELRYKALVEENRKRKSEHPHSLKLLKIDDEVFAKKKKDLLDEAPQGVKEKLSFAQDSAMSNFWQNSVASHWLKDMAADTGEYVKGKAKTMALGAAAMTVRLPWEAGRVVVGGTLATGGLLGKSLFNRFRRATQYLVKYPLSSVYGGARWLVKGGPGVIESIKAQSREDAAKITEKITAAKAQWQASISGTGTKAKEKISGTHTASREARQGVKFSKRDYKDRTKVNVDTLKATADELAAKAEVPVIEGGGVVIDLAKYKEELKKIDDAQKEPEKKAA